MIYFSILKYLILIALWVYQVNRTKQIIRDADGEAYLVRYFIWRPDWLDYVKQGLSKKAGRIYLHQILLSDHLRALHSHPWKFRSFILKGGYREYTTLKDVVQNAGYIRPNKNVKWDFANWPTDRETVYHDFQAPQYVRRPAAWRHRLELPQGKTTWTLVFIGARTQEWGFYPGGKFCHWKKYDTGTGLCEEPEVGVGS